MLNNLLERLEGERAYIKITKWHFTFICLISFVAICFFWYSIFQTALSVRERTIAAYKDLYGALPKGENPKTQSFQIFYYTNNPNAEHIKPTSTNAPSIAYGIHGDLPMYSWDTNDQMWK